LSDSEQEPAERPTAQTIQYKAPDKTLDFSTVVILSGMASPTEGSGNRLLEYTGDDQKRKLGPAKAVGPGHI
jgi:hypothetical protein